MKSEDKLKNYLEAYTREKYFTDRVLQIRKDIGIPDNGIPFQKESFFANFENWLGMLLSIQYNGVNYKTFGGFITPVYNDLFKPLPKIYTSHVMVLFFNIYILYNERCYEVFGKEIYGNYHGTTRIINFRNEYREMDGCCDCDLKVSENYMKEVSEKYPVMIGISPYTTQNEVIDLVKKRWDDIRKTLKDFVTDENIESFEEDTKRMSKIRSRETLSKEIEDMVYENKNLTLKKLGALIKEKTTVLLDPGEIGKIRSLALKRREKNKK